VPAHRPSRRRDPCTELHRASFVIFMILVSMALIDYVSDPLRFVVIGCRGVVA
jgi:hypothetical protein